MVTLWQNASNELHFYQDIRSMFIRRIYKKLTNIKMANMCSCWLWLCKRPRLLYYCISLAAATAVAPDGDPQANLVAQGAVLLSPVTMELTCWPFGY